MSKSLRIYSEMNVHAVTCPGVWFPNKGPVHLSLCFLGFHVRTKPFPPAFPLLFEDKFVFEKTFPGVSTLQDLQSELQKQPLYIELLQELSQHPNHPSVLATFETSGLDFLFPYPQLRPTYNSGIDLDLLLEPTSEFPGILSPKVEVSTKCDIKETRHPGIDRLHDSAVTLNCIPPMDAHPHIPPGNSRNRSRDREPFVVRRVNEDLIGRRPTRSPSPPRQRRGMQRSKSVMSGLNACRHDYEGLPAFRAPHLSQPRHEQFEPESFNHCHRRNRCHTSKEEENFEFIQNSPNRRTRSRTRRVRSGARSRPLSNESRNSSSERQRARCSSNSPCRGCHFPDNPEPGQFRPISPGLYDHRTSPTPELSRAQEFPKPPEHPEDCHSNAHLCRPPQHCHSHLRHHSHRGCFHCPLDCYSVDHCHGCVVDPGVPHLHSNKPPICHSNHCCSNRFSCGNC